MAFTWVDDIPGFPDLSPLENFGNFLSQEQYGEQNFSHDSDLPAEQTPDAVAQLGDNGPPGDVISEETRLNYPDANSERSEAPLENLPTGGGHVYNDFDIALAQFGINPTECQNGIPVNVPSALGADNISRQSEAGFQSTSHPEINYPGTATAIVLEGFQKAAENLDSVNMIPTSNDNREDLLKTSVNHVTAANHFKHFPRKPFKLPHTVDLPSVPSSSVATQSNRDRNATTMSSSHSTIKQESASGNQSSEEDGIILRFSSVQEANEYPERPTLPHDPTIPESLEEQKVLIKKIILAMKAYDEAEDNPGMIKPFREGQHCPLRMEIVAWNILDACISRHRHGPLLAGQKPKGSKSSGNFPSFRDRMDDILDTLRKHKTLCKHLLDAFFLYQFVDDPVHARQRVRSNRNLNKKKSEVMNAGKAALGRQSTPKGKKGTQKAVRLNNGEKLPTPLDTPGGSLGSSVQHSAPCPVEPQPQAPPVGYFSGVQQNLGNMSSIESSPLYGANSSVTGSGDNSPVANTMPYSSSPLENLGVQNPFPSSYHFNGNLSQNAPALYPSGKPVHDYSPTRPSRLHHVLNFATDGAQQASMPIMQPGDPHTNTQQHQNVAATAPLIHPPLSGFSPARMPYGRGSKRLPDTLELNPVGSPNKKARY
ncbi:hypothetical protein VTO42DRAFT_7717 [Malbranchea cinnamomea]